MPTQDQINKIMQEMGQTLPNVFEHYLLRLQEVLAFLEQAGVDTGTEQTDYELVGMVIDAVDNLEAMVTHQMK